MADIGIVTGSRVGVGYRGDDVILLSVEMNDPSDIQTVEYLFGAGESFLPPVGSEVLVHTVSEEQKVATVCDMSVVSVSGLNPGDRRMFAVSDGSMKAVIDLMGTGEVILNSGSGYAVEFGALKSGFDTLVQNFNTHVTTFNAHVTAFNAHIHPIVTPSTPPVPAPFVSLKTVAPASPSVASAASINLAKVEKVRL